MEFNRLGFHDKGVSHLLFNSFGTQLISVGVHEEESVVVWDVDKGSVIGQCGSTGSINDICLVKEMFATCGPNSLKLWKVEDDELLFYDVALPEDNLCLTALDHT